MGNVFAGSSPDRVAAAANGAPAATDAAVANGAVNAPAAMAASLDQPLRVVIVGTDPQVRLGLRALVEVTPDVEIVAEAADGNEAAAEARRSRADLVLLDSSRPRGGQSADIPQMSQLAGVGMLTWVDEADLMRTARPRQRPESGQLIRAVLDLARRRSLLNHHGEPERPGDPHAGNQRPPGGQCRALTPREREIMGLIAKGLSNRQIAERLVLSPKTVKNHICRIYQCIGVHERTEAVRRWREL